MKKFVIVTVAAMLAASTAAQAKTKPAALKWGDAPPALPAGAKMAVVSGDPSKEGQFVVRVKMPAGYAVPPHHHPADEMVRVKSGGPLSYGTGDNFDRTRFGTLEKDYHVTMMANMNHYVWTSTPTEIEVSGMGPFQITYVDPKDDPRGAAK
jgi:hypothetical protein